MSATEVTDRDELEELERIGFGPGETVYHTESPELAMEKVKQSFFGSTYSDL